jgi:hypothetical protein
MKIMLTLRFLALAAIGLLSTPVQAAIPWTGWDFYNQCAHAKDDPAAYACFVYLSAVRDMTAFADKIHSPLPNYCPPTGSTVDDSRQMFLGWAKMHQDLLSQPAADLVVRALSEVYPCQAGQTGRR